MFLSDFARKNLLIEFQRILSRAANKAIYDAKGKPTEPHLTKEIASQIPNGLYDALTSYIHGYEFEVHAIFCHQFPYVTFVDEPNKKCELGDLLFIYSEEGKDKGNALLLQAKKIKDSKFLPKDNERTQLALYTKSPEFTYTLSNSEIRKIPNDENFNGAQYLLLFPPYDCDCQYRSVLPAIVKTPSLANTDFFADKLLCLFSDEGIGKFEISQDTTDDWSKIIQDFIKRRNLNKNVMDNLARRDFSCGSHNLYKVDNFDDEKISETSVEIVTNQYGIAIYYILPKSDLLLDNPNINNNTGEKVKPFLIVYINAKKRKERAEYNV